MTYPMSEDINGFVNTLPNMNPSEFNNTSDLIFVKPFWMGVQGDEPFWNDLEGFKKVVMTRPSAFGHCCIEVESIAFSRTKTPNVYWLNSIGEKYHSVLNCHISDMVLPVPVILISWMGGNIYDDDKDEYMKGYISFPEKYHD